MPVKSDTICRIFAINFVARDVMIKLKAESGQCVPQITQVVRQTYLPGSSTTSHWVVLAYIIYFYNKIRTGKKCYGRVEIWVDG